MSQCHADNVTTSHNVMLTMSHRPADNVTVSCWQCHIVMLTMSCRQCHNVMLTMSQCHADNVTMACRQCHSVMLTMSCRQCHNVMQTMSQCHADNVTMACRQCHNVMQTMSQCHADNVTVACWQCHNVLLTMSQCHADNVIPPKFYTQIPSKSPTNVLPPLFLPLIYWLHQKSTAYEDELVAEPNANLVWSDLMPFTTAPSLTSAFYVLTIKYIWLNIESF